MKKHQVEDLFIILFIIGVIYGIYSLITSDEESINTQTHTPKTIQESKINETNETNKTNEQDIQINTHLTQKQKEENQSIINAIIEKHSQKTETNNTKVVVEDTIKEEDYIEEKEELVTKTENESSDIIENVEENQSKELIYTVQPGDVLGRIGNKFEIDYTLIKEYNNITSDIVIVGQVLKIPLSNDVLVKEETIVKKKEQNTSTKKGSLKELYKQIQNDILEKIISKTHESISFSSRSGYVNIRLTILKDGGYEQLVLQNGDKEYYDFIKDDIRSIFPIGISEENKDKFPRYFRMKIEY